MYRNKMGNERITHNVALFWGVGGIFNVADISKTYSARPLPDFKIWIF